MKVLSLKGDDLGEGVFFVPKNNPLTPTLSPKSGRGSPLAQEWEPSHIGEGAKISTILFIKISKVKLRIQFFLLRSEFKNS